MKLLDEIEELDGIFEREASPIVQIGRRVLDAPQREGFDRTVVGHHHAIDHFLFIKSLRLQVVHAIVGVIGGGMTSDATGLAVKEAFTAQFAGTRLGGIKLTVYVKLGGWRKI